ncbi:outer membrane beta-barrel protein [Saccharicrinis sp. FJH54]|uniref:outer membrane beta-barrel protein n=1 Tax=Saccharicrinis sp. FJH54 TaxID=3344665 RepID=UPI0035D40496
MSRPLHIILLVILFSFKLHSQIYFEGYTGYSFDTNPVKVPNYYSINDYEQAFYDVTTYSTGVNFGIGVGYTVNDNISFVVGVKTIQQKNSYANNDWLALIENKEKYILSGLYGTLETQNQSLEIMPQIVYRFNGSKFVPYFKAGMEIVNLKSNVIHTETDLSSHDFKEVEWEKSGKWNAGLIVNFGIEYIVNKHFSIYSELMFVNTEYVFRNSELKRYEIENEDFLRLVEETDIELSEEEGRTDFSHIGLNVGVRYYLK